MTDLLAQILSVFSPILFLAPYAILTLWFLLLIKWADYLISWSSSVAKKFWVSELMIWLTIVAFWTSAPEFFVNIVSVWKWETDLAVWNILWSTIVNTLLVIWVAALIKPMKTKKSTMYKEVPYLLLAALSLIVVSNDIFLSGASENVITRNEGILFLFFFIIFITYTFWIAKTKKEDIDPKAKKVPTSKAIILILAGFAWLIFWWNFVVSSATEIATFWWVPENIIGLTIVAIWTSLPELVASSIAAYRNNADLAIWNVVGSNIYNIFLILWASATTSNLPITKWMWYDILITFASIVLFFFVILFMWGKWKITRIEWAILSLSYFAYLWYLFVTQIG